MSKFPPRVWISWDQISEQYPGEGWDEYCSVSLLAAERAKATTEAFDSALTTLEAEFHSVKKDGMTSPFLAYQRCRAHFKNMSLRES